MTEAIARGLQRETVVMVDGHDNAGDFFPYREPFPATFFSFDDEGVRVIIVREGWTTRHVPFEHTHLIATRVAVWYAPPCGGYVPDDADTTGSSGYRPDPPGDPFIV